MGYLTHIETKREAPEALRKMLVVDDEAPTLFAMREYFSVCGFEVDTVQEREQAKDLIVDGAYAVAIVDLRLSGFVSTEGLEIVRFASQARPAMRIVVLTGYDTPEVEKAARSLGVDSFLRKPKPLSDIARVISALLPDEPPSARLTGAKAGG